MRDGLKIGEVARRSGLTVRALHHYDALGLVVPSGQTPAGHRLYTPADVARLQQVVSWKQLGFSLQQIAVVLRDPQASLAHVVDLHLRAARQRLAQTASLCAQLEKLAGLLQAGQVPSLDELLRTLERTTMHEKYFTPEQRETLKKRAEQWGPDALQESQRQWQELIAQAQAHFDAGTDPTSPAMLELAGRWQGLIDAFTGGDEGIRQNLTKMYREEPGVVEQALGPGQDRRLFEYVGRALAARKVG